MPETHTQDDSSDPLNNLTIDGLLTSMGLSPRKQQKPSEPTRMEKVMYGLSIVAEFAAWVLLIISFIAIGLATAGIFAMVSGGALWNLGFANSALLAIAGGLSGGAIMSAAISIRKLAQDARTAPAVMRMMKAAGLA